MLHEGLVTELANNTATTAYLADAGMPDRIYPLVIPQKVPQGAKQLPAVVYSTTDVRRQVVYCGTSGLVCTWMRLDCYAKTYDEAKELAAAVRQVLVDWDPSRGLLGGTVDLRNASIESEFDLQDFEPGLYRVSQSWMFWHAEN